MKTYGLSTPGLLFAATCPQVLLETFFEAIQFIIGLLIFCFQGDIFCFQDDIFFFKAVIFFFQGVVSFSQVVVSFSQVVVSFSQVLIFFFQVLVSFFQDFNLDILSATALTRFLSLKKKQVTFPNLILS